MHYTEELYYYTRIERSRGNLGVIHVIEAFVSLRNDHRNITTMNYRYSAREQMYAELSWRIILTTR